MEKLSVEPEKKPETGFINKLMAGLALGEVDVYFEEDEPTIVRGTE